MIKWQLTAEVPRVLQATIGYITVVISQCVGSYDTWCLSVDWFDVRCVGLGDVTEDDAKSRAVQMEKGLIRAQINSLREIEENL